LPDEAHLEAHEVVNDGEILKKPRPWSTALKRILEVVVRKTE